MSKRKTKVVADLPSIDIWTQYHWQCDNCASACYVDFMPYIGDQLECDECGSIGRVDGISEACHPKPR